MRLPRPAFTARSKVRHPTPARSVSCAANTARNWPVSMWLLQEFLWTPPRPIARVRDSALGRYARPAPVSVGNDRGPGILTLSIGSLWLTTATVSLTRGHRKLSCRLSRNISTGSWMRARPAWFWVVTTSLLILYCGLMRKNTAPCLWCTSMRIPTRGEKISGGSITAPCSTTRQRKGWWTISARCRSVCARPTTSR